MSADNNIGRESEQFTMPNFDQIFAKHNLTEYQRRAVRVNVQLFSQAIIEYYKGSDPEDSRETMDIWYDNLTISLLHMGHNVCDALAEIYEPVDQILSVARERNK